MVVKVSRITKVDFDFSWLIHHATSNSCIRCGRMYKGVKRGWLIRHYKQTGHWRSLEGMSDDDTGIWKIDGEYDAKQRLNSERDNQPVIALRNIVLGILEDEASKR